jgi:hypothetical protein
LAFNPGADDGFLSGEIENIVSTSTKIRGFLSASSADGGQSSGQSFVQMFRGFAGITPADGGHMFWVTRGSFVHVTSAPGMIGYTRKMFRGLVGITRRRRTNVFCPRTIVQNF